MMNNNQNDDHSGIDDDGNLITHDCVNGDIGECDDHRHASMCQCVKLLRLYATCFWGGLIFYFVEVYFGLYVAAVDVPPSSSSQALSTTP